MMHVRFKMASQRVKTRVFEVTLEVLLSMGTSGVNMVRTPFLVVLTLHIGTLEPSSNPKLAGFRVLSQALTEFTGFLRVVSCRIPETFLMGSPSILTPLGSPLK